MRVFLLLAASVALGLSSCFKAPHISGAKPPPAITVRVETIEVKPHPVTEEVIGTVRAKIRAAVEAKVSGRITRIVIAITSRSSARAITSSVTSRPAGRKIRSTIVSPS